jgi:hypothetical protein
MPKTRKARPLAKGRLSECVAWTADASTNSENLLAVQSARLIQRFGLPPSIAAVVAELAFTREARS